MSTAEAIALLREKMDLKQQAFADRLGVTLTSISRYENGREPSRQVLKKLADVAKDERLRDLQDMFTDKWKASITARLNKLKSSGTERAVPLDDLQRWRAMAALIQQEVRDARQSYIAVLSKSSPELHMKLHGTHRLLLQVENNVAGDLAKSIELYINIPKKKGTKP